jgi:hypothetical protein
VIGVIMAPRRKKSRRASRYEDARNRLTTADCRLPISRLASVDCDCRLPIAIAGCDCRLPIAIADCDCRLPIAIADCRLPDRIDNPNRQSSIQFGNPQSQSTIGSLNLANRQSAVDNQPRFSSRGRMRAL